jgi:hypothetical protein
MPERLQDEGSLVRNGDVGCNETRLSTPGIRKFVPRRSFQTKRTEYGFANPSIDLARGAWAGMALYGWKAGGTGKAPLRAALAFLGNWQRVCMMWRPDPKAAPAAIATRPARAAPAQVQAYDSAHDRAADAPGAPAMTGPGPPRSPAPGRRSRPGWGAAPMRRVSRACPSRSVAVRFRLPPAARAPCSVAVRRVMRDPTRNRVPFD